METREFFLFDTVNTVTAPVLTDETMAAVTQACQRYERLFSRFDEEGELYRVNHARGRAVEVDPELAAFIGTALSYCEASEGLFDITMGAVTRLWDFKRGRVPDESDVRKALCHVDWRGVRVGQASVQLDDPSACLELGGIAKGYIADRVLDVLGAQGVEHAIVNLGGNVAVRGGRPDGSPWQVGLRQPLASRDMPLMQSFAVVGMMSGSVVTSGIYERAFERGGRSYHHILDPRTGFPAQTDVVSATVISDTSLDGDGYSTTLILMGVDRALSFSLEHTELEVVLVDDRGQVLATPGVGERIPFRLTAGQ